ncbi:hypothetical protein LR48_Vigan02g075800 [Vigna angularis]|uniref:Uncharacterized protein n=1 Tax=Phaseolus angularis TaxID=3914 RepID=A0A0L9TVI3_PHAAN|nr:hypothetical protein LR48_Vigan02g075800 [Vigna angularis]
MLESDATSLRREDTKTRTLTAALLLPHREKEDTPKLSKSPPFLQKRTNTKKRKGVFPPYETRTRVGEEEKEVRTSLTARRNETRRKEKDEDGCFPFLVKPRQRSEEENKTLAKRTLRARESSSAI